ncbi:MAG: TVP38/TMEM64 family protein [Deinococcales bacterium]
MTSTMPRTSFLRKHAQKLIALAFWLFLIAAYAIYTLSQGISPLESLSRLVNWLKSNPLSPLIFILIYTLRPLILFSAAVLTLAGGFLFGPFWGSLVVIIGSNAGASLAYLLGRYFGSDTLGKALEGEGLISRYAKSIKEHSFASILTMRFVFLPYDLVNYLAGIMKVSYGSFILATILGALPGTLAFVLAGASIKGDFDLSKGFPSLNPWTLLASAVIFVLSLLLSRLFKKRSQLA